MYEPSDPVVGIGEIRDMFPTIHPSQLHKKINRIDSLCRLWIERSPFVVLSTTDRQGHVDVSPKGDPAGFVKVIDDKTLAIPDRPGNHLFDSLTNILETGQVGLIFFVPGRNEVVRVKGRGIIVKDRPLLEGMAVNGRLPGLAILVRVQEAFFHCGKSIIRSKLWDPTNWPSIDGLPSYGQALVKHGNLQSTLEEAEAGTRYNDEQRLYDE